jgi:CelD/BcsL family acetyltransferase involved in cellulose biosynthesis
MDVPASTNPRSFPLHVRTDRCQACLMADLISLQSKLLAAAVAQRDAPRWRRMSRKELDQILDPCAWREPVYAWLLANHAKVVRVRQHRNGWNRMHWAEIARIMEVEGVKGIARRAAQRQLGA